MVWDKSKYILQANPYYFKFKSLEDNVYFTLRDIFLNISTEFKMYEANELNKQISKGIAFEDRTEDFSYVKLESNGDLDYFNGKHIDTDYHDTETTEIRIDSVEPINESIKKVKSIVEKSDKKTLERLKKLIEERISKV